IPSFLYGHMLSFCDAARQVTANLPITTFSNSPHYNPTKVVNIAYNCTHGLMVIAQIIEELLRSRIFALILATIFPSSASDFYNDSKMFGRAIDGNNNNNINNNNGSGKTLQTLSRMAIDGIVIDSSKMLAPKNTNSHG